MRRWRETGSAWDAGVTGLGGWEVAGAGLGWRKGLWGWGTLQYLLIITKVLYSVLNVVDTAGEGEGRADRGGSTDGYSEPGKQSRQLVQSCCTAQGREAQREGMYVSIRLSHAAVWQKLAQHWKTVTLQLKKINN